ncbi:preprotein translocase subunit SecG [Patescibacteria group bacterium]|nr:preprotein translocase subunit SecG [Patescibacteria group bacterium]MBU1683835.1 preprotein translocase subunit SecG [Patescibacteria group bacterium]MBU1934967.1 preprotein translocase subunit SecG [Patescibacteria group bacterium]
MQNIILIIQVVISILLIILVLVQNKDGGLSAVFGGGESFQSTKRGPEKFIYNATIVLGAAFMINAILIVLI